MRPTAGSQHRVYHKGLPHSFLLLRIDIDHVGPACSLYMGHRYHRYTLSSAFDIGRTIYDWDESLSYLEMGAQSNSQQLGSCFWRVEHWWNHYLAIDGRSCDCHAKRYAEPENSDKDHDESRKKASLDHDLEGSQAPGYCNGGDLTSLHLLESMLGQPSIQIYC
jgi:hypothetical protein